MSKPRSTARFPCLHCRHDRSKPGLFDGWVEPRKVIEVLFDKNMSTDEMTRDFYVVAHLGIRDDDECSKGDWLNQELEKERDDVRFGVAWLHQRERKMVQEWAQGLFASRLYYYVCIIEERTKKNFPILEPIYLSPPLDGKVKFPRASQNAEKQVAYYQSRIVGLIDFDQEQALLARRKQEREEMK